MASARTPRPVDGRRLSRHKWGGGRGISVIGNCHLDELFGVPMLSMTPPGASAVRRCAKWCTAGLPPDIAPDAHINPCAASHVRVRFIPSSKPTRGSNPSSRRALAIEYVPVLQR